MTGYFDAIGLTDAIAAPIYTSGVLGAAFKTHNRHRTDTTGASNGSKAITFNGSSGFSGYTSSAGAHSHTMALDNSGGNAAHNNMRLYYVNTHT